MSSPTSPSPSIPDQIAAYYAAKAPYTAQIAALSTSLAEPDPAAVAAAAEPRSPTRSRPPHKDNIYPDPVWPHKNDPSFPQRKIPEYKPKEGEEVVKGDMADVHKMVVRMREEAAKGKTKEAKEARERFAEMDKAYEGGLFGWEGVLAARAAKEAKEAKGGKGGGSSGGGKGEGKGKGKK